MMFENAVPASGQRLNVNIDEQLRDDTFGPQCLKLCGAFCQKTQDIYFESI